MTPRTLRVVQLGGGPGLRFCSWMFARAGHDVVVVDTGDPASASVDRFGAAFLDEGIHTLELAGSSLSEALADCDVVLGDGGLGWETVAAAMPVGALTGAVDDFGPHGPYAGWQGAELVFTTQGGAAAYTTSPDGTPVYGYGDRYQYLTGLQLHIALLAVLLSAGNRRPESVPAVHASVFETVVWTLPYPTTQFQYNGRTSIAEQSGPRFVCRCGDDGWVAVYAGRDWIDMMRLLDGRVQGDDQRFVELHERFRHAVSLGKLFDDWCAERTTDQAVADGAAHDVAVTTIRSPADVVREQGSADVGLPYHRIAAARMPQGVPERASGNGVGPLAGFRVLDLSHIWSGPTTTRVLGGLGADVLKIEHPDRPDWLRGGLTGEVTARYPEEDLGVDPQNRNAWFNTVNIDKRGVGLDLKNPRGRELFLQLVAESDAIVVNFRPGVLERMGLGYDILAAANPRLVLLEMPGFRRSDPRAAAPSFGAQFEAASGSAFVNGAGADGPLLTGFALGDPVAGMFGAAACTQALMAVVDGAPGVHLELPQSEAMRPLMGEYLHAAAAGTALDQESNADRRFFPHGLFPTAADEGWVGIAVRTEDQRRALADHIGFQDGEPGIQDGERFTTAVTRWVRRQPRAVETVGRLQARGVPAAVLQDGRGMVADPQLAATGFLRPLTHPSCGTHLFPALPVTVDGGRLGAIQPAPVVAGDTAVCLRDVLGLSDAAIRELVEAGVIVARDAA